MKIAIGRKFIPESATRCHAVPPRSLLPWHVEGRNRKERTKKRSVSCYIEFTPVPLLHFALAIEFACFGWVFCLIALAAGCVAFFPIRYFLL